MPSSAFLIGHVSAFLLAGGSPTCRHDRTRARTSVVGANQWRRPVLSTATGTGTVEEEHTPKLLCEQSHSNLLNLQNIINLDDHLVYAWNRSAVDGAILPDAMIYAWHAERIDTRIPGLGLRSP